MAEQYPEDMVENQKKISELLQEEDGAVADSPTAEGGQVGANMTGGGTLGNPETTSSRLGDPGVGPIVLENADESPEDRFEKVKEMD